jgi:antitoxin component YwqK of YwqJK toxin-antitoxin module
VHKRILSYLIFVFCVLTSYSQTEEKAPFGPRGVKNKRDELRRRQEVWKTYDGYGDLISEIEYKNDKKEGKSTIYYQGGEKVKEESQYFDGKKDDAYVRKYVSGQTAIEGTYNLGVKIGLWTSYYEDGQVKMEGNYVNGKKDGEWKIFNRKGVLVKSINFSATAPPPPAAKKPVNGKNGTNKPAIKK